MPHVAVPRSRWPRWLDNFTARHGGVALAVIDGHLSGTAPDGSTFRARLPFDRTFVPLTRDFLAGEFHQAMAPPDVWGVLLVRKGGFAVAALRGDHVLGSKVGRRHVQGRTKAGGQSQQRFANRRANQARRAYDAAADHAVAVLGPVIGAGPVVAGGDREALDAVLADVRLTGIRRVGPRLSVPGEPRRDALDAAVVAAGAARVDVTNA